MKNTQKNNKTNIILHIYFLVIFLFEAVVISVGAGIGYFMLGIINHLNFVLVLICSFTISTCSGVLLVYAVYYFFKKEVKNEKR